MPKRKDYHDKPKPRVYIPKTFPLDNIILTNNHFKVITSKQPVTEEAPIPRIMLAVTPMVKTALDKLRRGRSGSNDIESYPDPAMRFVKDKLEGNVKGIIKKALVGNKPQMVNGRLMHILDVHLIKFDDNTYEICNPYHINKLDNNDDVAK